MKDVNKQQRLNVTVIIPTYNEEDCILDCLGSLSRQIFVKFDVIVVDDGSTDNTINRVRNFVSETRNVKVTFFRQKHRGPGETRNFGALKAKGEVVVFVDADMTFDELFISKLVLPIENGHAIGTNTQDEFLSNQKNFWAVSWNIGRFFASRTKYGNPFVEMNPDKSDFGGVYRAILKSEFIKVEGFDKGGDYTDDTSLAKKLKKRAYLAKGAKYYHKNPSSFAEVWNKAVWIGSDKNFSPDLNKKIVNILIFFPLVSIAKGIVIALKYKYLPFIAFKIVYDSAIFWSQIKSFKLL